MTELFITCSQGLEPLLQAELESFGYQNSRKGYRGVHLPDATMNHVYRINYCSRLAGRVLWPLKHFRCFDSDMLYKEAVKIEWEPLIPIGKTFAIDSNVTHRKLRNSLYASQIVKDAICDQLRSQRGERPSIDPKNPDVQLNLFIRDASGLLYFDTSGQPLNKRGYRQEQAIAPLQETYEADKRRPPRRYVRTTSSPSFFVRISTNS